MSIQSQFNADLFKKRPLIKGRIEETEGTSKKNQMINRTIHEACSSNIAIDCMTEKQLTIFQKRLFDIFENNQWF